GCCYRHGAVSRTALLVTWPGNREPFSVYFDGQLLELDAPSARPLKHDEPGVGRIYVLCGISPIASVQNVTRANVPIKNSILALPIAGWVFSADPSHSGSLPSHQPSAEQ